MAKQAADDRQAQTLGNRDAGGGMAEVMYPDVVQTGPGANATPRLSEVHQRLVLDPAGNNVWVLGGDRQHPQAFQYMNCGFANIDRLGAGLAVGQLDDPAHPIYPVPSGAQNFAHTRMPIGNRTRCV
jgi:hypothetical protein